MELDPTNFAVFNLISQMTHFHIEEKYPFDMKNIRLPGHGVDTNPNDPLVIITLWQKYCTKRQFTHLTPLH